MRAGIRATAFTLIELLFVVAVIAILAAISVPNFLEAQVRSKIARCHADMAVVEQGLRSYYADNNVYPPHRSEVHDFLEACAKVELADAAALKQPADSHYSWTGDDKQAESRPGNKESIMGSGGYTPSYGYRMSFPILIPASYDLAVLTTPIAYIGTSLPLDPFHDLRGTPFTYINLSELESFAEQTGLFRRYILMSYGPDTDASQSKIVNPVRGPWMQFDPTNGTVSGGDILVFGRHDTRVSSQPLDLTVPRPPAEPSFPEGDTAI